MPLLLKVLHDEGVLMDVDGEYRLQTTEGAAWEGEYRKRLASIKNDETRIAAERGQLVSKEISTALGGIAVTQGVSNVARKAILHYGKEQPPAHDGPVIWCGTDSPNPKAQLSKRSMVHPQTMQPCLF